MAEMQNNPDFRADRNRHIERSSGAWFLEGAKHIVSIPAIILIMSFIGFGGLTAEAELSVWQAMSLALFTWALPSAVVVAGAIIQEVPFYTTVIAVVLVSIRLLPMTMALMPLLRSNKSSLIASLCASYFIAVTAWIVAIQKLPDIPRQGRMPFFFGLGICLSLISTMAAGLANIAAPNLPPVLAAGLLLLTPIYFLLSMTQAARLKTDYMAIGFGFVLGPLFHLISPQTGLLWVGLIGGSLAYGVGRLVERNKPAP